MYEYVYVYACIYQRSMIVISNTNVCMCIYTHLYVRSQSWKAGCKYKVQWSTSFREKFWNVVEYKNGDSELSTQSVHLEPLEQSESPRAWRDTQKEKSTPQQGKKKSKKKEKKKGWARQDISALAQLWLMNWIKKKKRQRKWNKRWLE